MSKLPSQNLHSARQRFNPLDQRQGLKPSLARGRIILFGLLASMTGMAGNRALAITFSGDPAADQWTLIGNSLNSSFYVRGHTSFNIYKTTFFLGSSDNVSPSGANPLSFRQGDAYLYSGLTDSWRIGDRILGFGIGGWAGQQEGGWPTQTGSSGISYLKFDPAGTGVFGNASTPKPNNDTSIYQSPGSFGFDINRSTQNSSGQVQPPYQTFQSFEVQSIAACGSPAPCNLTSNPYGNLASSGNNRSTTAGGNATLPMRVFGRKGSTDFSWSSFQFFINTSLLPAGTAEFGNQSTFDFSTHSADFGSTSSEVTCENASTVLAAACDFVAASGSLGPLEWSSPQAGVGAPSPLPLLGAGVALSWSHRLRARIKARRSGRKPDQSLD